MSQPRREFLRHLGGLGGLVASGSIAGCGSRSETTALPGDVRSTRTESAISSVEKDWDQSFSALDGANERESITSLALDDEGTLAFVGASNDGELTTPWIRAVDSSGSKRWQFVSKPDASSTRTTDAPVQGWSPFGITPLERGFIVGIFEWGPEAETVTPTLRRFDSAGTKRWTATSFSAVRGVDFTTRPSVSGPPICVVTDGVEDAGVQLHALRADGSEAWTRSLAGDLLQPVIRSVSDGRLRVAGRSSQDDQAPIRTFLIGKDGQVQRETTLSGDWDRHETLAVLGADLSSVALNARGHSFQVWTTVVRLGADGSIKWHRTIRGWQVSAITTRHPFAPANGMLLTMHNNGEMKTQDPGATLLALGRDGEVRWSWTGLDQSRGIGPTIGDAVATADHLFVGGAAPADGKARLARFSPA